MDRFVIREPRTGGALVLYTDGNQIHLRQFTHDHLFFRISTGKSNDSISYKRR